MKRFLLAVFVVLMIFVSGCATSAEKNQTSPVVENPETCQIMVKTSVIFEDYVLTEIGATTFEVTRPNDHSNWKVSDELLRWHETMVLPLVDKFKSNINTRWSTIVTKNFYVSANGFWNSNQEIRNSWDKVCPKVGFTYKDNILIETNLNVNVGSSAFLLSKTSEGGNEYVFVIEADQFMDILTGKILPVTLNISPVAVSPENFSTLTKNAVVLYKATDPSFAMIYSGLIYGFGSWDEDRVVVTTMENGIIYGALIPDPSK